ncbi:uncharacterized protein LOC144179693 [Haemaphysalis longicornis]
MDLNKLRKPDLVLMCEELGIELGRTCRKPHIIEAIRAIGAADDELEECWSIIEEMRNEAKLLEEREREEKRLERGREEKRLAEEREERRRAEEREDRRRAEEQAFQLKKMELGESARQVRERSEESTRSEASTETVKMKNFMQPYRVGEDIGLFLVNFERTCEKINCARGTWPQRLLTLLPCEAADVVARLTAEQAGNYEAVKKALLDRFRLSAEAFRQRFRGASVRAGESFTEYGYKLKADLTEWLKGAEAYGNHDKVVEATPENPGPTAWRHRACAVIGSCVPSERPQRAQ